MFRWIRKYLKPYRGRMCFAFLLTIVNTLLTNSRSYITGVIVDEVFEGGMKERLFLLTGLLLAAVLSKDVFRMIDHYILEGTSQRVIYNMRVDLYKNLCTMDFSFFSKNRTGDIMTRMSGDLESIRHFVAWVLNGIIENVALFISAVVILSMINWRLTLCLLLVSPAIVYMATRLRSRIRPAHRATRDSLSNLNTVVQENISGNRVVKAFTREDYEIGRFDRANEKYREKSLEATKIAQKYIPYLDSLANSLNVIVLVVGGYMVIRGYMTVGNFVTFNSMVWAINTPMRSIGWLVGDTQNAIACGNMVKEFLEVRPELIGGSEKKHIDGEVEFKNVTFSYGEEDVLKDISFTAKRGETVALLGRSGSGKTTIVNLICRFYDATEGEVKIDGINVRDYNMTSLRSSIAVAMQDIFLFSDTIEGNIAYGRPDASMDEIIAAAKAADADEFIRKMPQGYDTIIGERGVGLSGGQKQRIALARALLRDPSILILDDTTSSVDSETEHYIQHTLDTLCRDKTTFIIAHRISSVKNADLILVIDDGRIVERGTHDELLALGGMYGEIYSTQYRNFDIEKGGDE